jgi:hypothetical protein
MQNRSGCKAVVADDAAIGADDEGTRSAFRFIASGTPLEPLIQGFDTGVERVQLMIRRERFGSRRHS